ELFDHVWPLKDSFWGYFIACFLSNKCAFFSTKNILYVILPWEMLCKKLCRGRRHKRMVTEIEQVIEKWHKKTAPCYGSRYSAAL
ncbi:hypothetical protein, partial [Salmonella enterica]|uniref:hypothetical protein n=1 Tax=Salmonella enterica TaxID=28901 RepID=UPI001C385D7A